MYRSETSGRMTVILINVPIQSIIKVQKKKFMALKEIERQGQWQRGNAKEDSNAES